MSIIKVHIMHKGMWRRVYEADGWSIGAQCLFFIATGFFAALIYKTL